MVQLHIDAAFAHGDLFGFEQLALQAGVRFADQQASACADNTVPGDAFSRGGSSHSAAGSARASGKAQGSSEVTIS